MSEVYICDAIRTPVGRYGGSLSQVRADDLGALPIKSLVERNPDVNWLEVDDVILGCANQAGEDNRNVARMSLLLAGLSEIHSRHDRQPALRLRHGCDRQCARMIRSGEADLIVAGGVESMSRAPFVMDKSAQAFSRSVNLYDSTIGWRFINRKMDEMYGTEPLILTAENIAEDLRISREDQDRFAHWSQEKTAEAQKNGWLAEEIVPVTIPQRKGDPVVVDTDEHPRLSSVEKLATLKPVSRKDGTVTAGNASGVNDGAAAVILASEEAVKKHKLTPRARIMGMSTAGVLPRIMGMGPVPATKKLLPRLNLTLDDFDLIELNEAFAAQALGCLRELGLDDFDPRLNRCGGAIALGHPLGASGARIVTTAYYQLLRSDAKRALCTMCIGVGQGISMVIEKV